MLREFLAGVEKRKAVLGLSETSAGIDAMRNKGGRRTSAKRELLRRTDKRAKAAGLSPVTSYY